MNSQFVAFMAVLAACMLLLVHMPLIARADGICEEDLGTRIDEILSQESMYRSQWGIQVQVLKANASTNGEYRWATVYGRNDRNYFTPASNNKILTTSAAFISLGPNFTISTGIYANQQNDICIYGMGDPSITVNQLVAAAMHIKQNTSLGASGIRDIYVDAGYFRGDTIPGSWEWEDINAAYGAQPTSINVDENSITLSVAPGLVVGAPLVVAFVNPDEAGTDFTVAVNGTTETVPQATSPLVPIKGSYVIRGSGGTQFVLRGQMALGAAPIQIQVPVMDPATRFGALFRNVLQNRAGVSVSGHVVATYAGDSFCAPQNLPPSSPKNSNNKDNNNNNKDDDDDDPAAPSKIYTITSRPLQQLINYTMQVSDNTYAETFLRLMGAHFADQINTTATNPSARQLGLQFVRETLNTTLGVPIDSFFQDDGSGLSRHCFVSPEALADTLRALVANPATAVYQDLLPVGGESGTLANRFTKYPGRIKAKTGSMTGVFSLSGYALGNSNYEGIVFSVIANQMNQPGSVVYASMDQIVEMLLTLKQCPYSTPRRQLTRLESILIGVLSSVVFVALVVLFAIATGCFVSALKKRQRRYQFAPIPSN